MKLTKEENIERYEVERMLAFNEKLVLLNRVASHIAHDINNPLFAISNSFQLSKKYLPTDNKRVNEAVQILEREIKRVKTLSRDMYRFVIRYVEEPTLSDLAAIMNTAIKIIEWSKKLKDTEIVFKKQGSFPLKCSPVSLQQAFMNLIINAVEALDGKGKVSIDILEEDREYRIDFVDNGPGIPDDIKPQIFLPVKSEKSSRGVGLGLHISYNIVSNHGGTITLDGDCRQGAHFIIRIPKTNKGGQSNDKNSADTINR